VQGQAILHIELRPPASSPAVLRSVDACFVGAPRWGLYFPFKQGLVGIREVAAGHMTISCQPACSGASENSARSTRRRRCLGQRKRGCHQTRGISGLSVARQPIPPIARPPDISTHHLRATFWEGVRHRRRECAQGRAVQHRFGGAARSGQGFAVHARMARPLAKLGCTVAFVDELSHMVDNISHLSCFVNHIQNSHKQVVRHRSVA